MPATTRALSKLEMDNVELAPLIRSIMREELAEGLDLKLKPIKDTWKELQEDSLVLSD